MDKVKQPVLRILLLAPAGLDAARVRHALLDGSMDCEMLHIAAAEELPAAFDTFHPDVVICACDSPQLDGRVVLEALHRDHPTVPVIVITHELTDLEAVAFIESEAKGYALKSDLRRIASEVRHAVSREEAIRARKATERELREALEQLKLFRTMIDHSPDGIEIIDPETRRFVDVNEAVCTSLGYTREEMLGMHVLDIDASDDQMELELLDGQLRERGQIRFERVHRRKDGSEVPVEVNLKMLELDRPYALSITRDITKRKETEAELLRLNRGLRTLSEVNRTVVRATSEAQLMRDICGIMSGHGGYRLAWIGLARDDEEKSIAVMALSGAGEGYLKGLDLSWADVPSGRGPAGIAIRSGDTQIVQNIGNDPRFDAWRVAAQEYGFGSSITLPVMASGRAFGVLNLYSATTDAFGESELELLEEVASDLAFGITNLRTRLERDEAVQQREQQVVRLRDNMEDAVEAIATVVEMRDPYTAGHQRRVAELTAVQETNLRVVSELDTAQVLNAVARNVLDLAGADDVNIFLHDPADGQLTFGTALWRSKPSWVSLQKQPDQFTRAVLQSSRSLVINYAREHPYFASAEAQPSGEDEGASIEAIAGFPLLGAAGVVGVMSVAYLRPHVFEADAVRILGLLASQAAVAITKARLYEETRQRLEELTMLHEVSLAGASTLSPEEIAERVIAVVEQSLGFEHQSVYLIDDKRR
ncbi:MAG: GAF domain-containing protein, partial [Acidihalobacter sp.]